MMKRLVVSIAVCIISLYAFCDSVLETVRQIPQVDDVDIVVVGGTSAGVSAAIAAAEEGASVFLVSDRPYLGTDITGTYRLWLEPGEEPLTDLEIAAFTPPPVELNALPLTYTADRPSEGAHQDTVPPSMLTDGNWASAITQSVQYGGDVNIIADLGESKEFDSLKTYFYQDDYSYEVQSVTFSISDDGVNWQQVAFLNNDLLGPDLYKYEPIILTAPVGGTARYVKFFFEQAPTSSRMLIAEIQVVTDDLHGSGVRPPTPINVKETFDLAAYEAGVTTLVSSYVTDILTDENGRPAGVVVANRSGRQAIKAKTIVDATFRSTAARLAGASFSAYPSGPQEFLRYVIRGPVQSGPGIVSSRVMPTPVSGKYSGDYDAIEYTLSINMPDGSFDSFAAAEQTARDLTYHVEQADSSDMLFQVPPDHMTGRASYAGAWTAAGDIPIGAFQPASIDGIYVVGGCADVPRPCAEQMLRPLNYMRTGDYVGRAAAVEAMAAPALAGVELAAAAGTVTHTGQVKESFLAPRPTFPCRPKIQARQRHLPVLAQYDVVIVGGGTSGAPAAIGAARYGADTLVIEYLHGLGGVGTLGLIGAYYGGNRVGFTDEVNDGIAAMNAPELCERSSWNIEAKMEWYRREVLSAGGDIWLHTLGCGAFVENSKLKGVIVSTPLGRGVILADVVIDSTGNNDITIAAGAEYDFTDADDAALQGTGLPYRNIEDGYRKPMWLTNTDWTFVDESDSRDVWHVYYMAKRKFSDEVYDLGQLIQTRERRRAIGDYRLDVPDFINLRTFPDTIVQAYGSKFDSHGMTVHPYLLINETPPYVYCNLPYRCLLPQGLEGVLVTGLGISAHRDAIPVVRMQADSQNQGYAAGIAAAMSLANGGYPRNIDIDALQDELVAKGIIESAVKSWQDNFPFSAGEVSNAVQNLINAPAQDYAGLETIAAQLDLSIPMLRDAYNDPGVSDQAKLKCAHILGIYNDPTGAARLLQEVQSYAVWDEGWNYSAGGQYGKSVSLLDSYIIALGRTGYAPAVQAVVDKLAILNANSYFSHHRAAAMALENLADTAAAQPLAQLLAKPGMSGHYIRNIPEAEAIYSGSENETIPRHYSLREIILARALYRCGDYNGMGEQTLRAYIDDFRGHFSRHAYAALQNPDFNCDDCVNIIDMSILGLNWLKYCDMCDGSDIDGDHRVDWADLTKFLENWLK